MESKMAGVSVKRSIDERNIRTSLYDSLIAFYRENYRHLWWSQTKINRTHVIKSSITCNSKSETSWPGVKIKNLSNQLVHGKKKIARGKHRDLWPLTALLWRKVFLKTQDYCLGKYSKIPLSYFTKEACPCRCTSSNKTFKAANI